MLSGLHKVSRVFLRAGFVTFMIIPAMFFIEGIYFTNRFTALSEEGDMEGKANTLETAKHVTELSIWIAYAITTISLFLLVTGAFLWILQEFGGDNEYED